MWLRSKYLVCAAPTTNLFFHPRGRYLSRLPACRSHIFIPSSHPPVHGGFSRRAKIKPCGGRGNGFSAFSQILVQNPFACLLLPHMQSMQSSSSILPRLHTSLGHPKRSAPSLPYAYPDEDGKPFLPPRG